jgi:benzodiazapine receptor
VNAGAERSGEIFILSIIIVVTSRRSKKMENIRMREFPLLLLCIVICQAAGFIGSFFTNMSVSTWYLSLAKPWFTPPGWLIGLVWFILFVLMGVSMFFIWRNNLRLNNPPIKNAIVLFGVQLIVNVLWSAIFFGLRSPIAGLGAIAALWILILVTIIMFWRVSRDAALLLVPYILWVSFAAYLNYTVWVLNP